VAAPDGGAGGRRQEPAPHFLQHLVDSNGAPPRRRGRSGRGQDLVGLLADQHSRMDGMFRSIMQTR
jgi:hypothetical protein